MNLVIETHQSCPPVAYRHSCGCRDCDVGAGWISLGDDVCQQHTDIFGTSPEWFDRDIDEDRGSLPEFVGVRFKDGMELAYL